MSRMRDLLQNLADKGLTLGSVESMTGGLFAAKATEVPGAGNVFKGAIVSYSVPVKENLLGVNGKTISANGVVSERVAKEMALCGREKLGVDVALAVTGNAGPTAEPGEAKVGEVYFALATKDAVWAFGYHFEGNRQSIREQAVDMMVSFGLSQYPGPTEEK